MPEMRDLIDSVAGDLTAVRWPSADELRRRVRRRRQRAIAAVALVTAVTAGAAGLARPDREPPPPPATSPTVGASPVRLPRSVLLQPEDVGAEPDSRANREDAFQPIRFPDATLEACLRQRAPELLAVRPRYSQSETFVLGTEGHRPARPFLLDQAVYRLSAPEAAVFLRDVRVAIESCTGYTLTGEIEQPGGKVEARARHSWSIVASGFAGDESILVRYDSVTRNAETGEVLGKSSGLSAYLRVDDLVTVLNPRPGTSAGDLRRMATTAAQRLCADADTPC
jgi:hypothetical protein